MSRVKAALFGYFDFLIENPEVMSQYMETRNRFVTKHLNKLGGTKLLSMLPREYFYNELMSIKDQILKVKGAAGKDDEDIDNSFFE